MHMPHSSVPDRAGTAPVSSRSRVRDEAKAVRSSARRILEDRDPWKNRMTMILSLIVILVVAVGMYALCGALYAVGYLIFGEALWLDVVAYSLLGVLSILVTLPLAMGLWRLACLMVSFADGETGTPLTPEDLLYPFTSARAYGRSMAVGLEFLGWIALMIGVPVGGSIALTKLFTQLAARGLHTSLCSLLSVLSVLLCVVFGVVMLFLSGKRMGYGYFVFTREDETLKAVHRHFKSLRRGFVKPFILRMSLAGWVALSFAAVLIPFVVHTIPYALFISAVYGQGLEA